MKLTKATPNRHLVKVQVLKYSTYGSLWLPPSVCEIEAATLCRVVMRLQTACPVDRADTGPCDVEIDGFSPPCLVHRDVAPWEFSNFVSFRLN